MKASHRPLGKPLPKKGTCSPKIIEMPRVIITQAMACPSHEAQRVARRRFSVIAQKMERTMRPPSNGNPGTRLKTPTKMLIGPSHSSKVVSGLS